MKNKNVISLTILLIAAVIIGVIGMSKLVESSWQTTSGKDNQLTVNEENLQAEESTFDYPYINYSQLNAEDKELYKTFEQISDSILPENKEFTYQQAANKLGEAIKYLTGYTEHQKTPMVIELADVNMFTLSRGLDIDCYTCKLFTDDLFIGAVIDTTGQFWYLGFEDIDVKTGGWFYKSPPSQNISEQLVETSLQYLNELGVSDTIVGYYTEIASNEKDNDTNAVYIVHFETEVGSNLCFTLNKEYGLIYYSKYPESLYTHEEFIPI